jgi:hypothetical protein
MRNEVHEVGNSLSGPIVRAVALRKVARELRSKSAAARLHAQEARSARYSRVV